MEACLRREFREELGIDVEVGRLWRSLSHLYPDRTVTLYFHFCRHTSGDLRPLDVAELRWVPPHHLAELEFVEGDGPVLPDLIRDLAGFVPETG